MKQSLPDQRVVDALARFLRTRPPSVTADDTRLTFAQLGGKDAWRVEAAGHALLVKRYRPLQHEADVQWEHRFLLRLAATGLATPRPEPAFDGYSWWRVGERVWGALTFLPGRSMAWEPRPPLEAAGTMLARYHAAVRVIPTDEQRPSAVPLERLWDYLVWDGLASALGDRHRARDLEAMLRALPDELRAAGFDTHDALIVHGDCTTDNIVIGGDPPEVTGLIDFGSAHIERWPADLGAAVWRSGRSGPAELGLDARRVCEFVVGYHRQAPLDAAVLRAVPLLIKARGLQLFVRRMLRVPPGYLPELRPQFTQTYERVRWARDHQEELAAVIGQAISRHSPGAQATTP